MATGWPMKVSYANGDVFSASDINDTNGTINLLTSTTLSYAAGKNGTINGAMDFWQRGTTFTTTGGVAYTADRWMSWATNALSSVTTSRQTVSDTTNLPSIQYCTKFQRVAANTNTNILVFFNTLESADSYRFAGKTVTLSFYAKKGANFSAASNILTSSVRTGTGTDQRMYDFTGNTEVTQNNTLTTTWQRFTQTVSVAASTTEIAVSFQFTPVGVAGADDSFSITGVQLELGSTATTFSRAGGTIQGELGACQRYYALIASGTELCISMGANYTATQADGFLPFPVTMRTTPTLVATSGTGYYAFIRNGGSDAFNSLTLYAASLNGTQIYNSTEISGTAGHAGTFRTQNASASIAVSAEL